MILITWANCFYEINPPLLNGWGRFFKKLSHLAGGTKNFARRHDPEKGGLPLFYYFTVQLHLLCVWGGGWGSRLLYYILVLQSFELTKQDSHPSPSIVLKHCTICIILIHSDSLQRMLTALFKLVCNTQESTRIIFLNTEAWCFLILKMFWCLNALSYFLSSHFRSDKCLLT